MKYILYIGPSSRGVLYQCHLGTLSAHPPHSFRLCQFKTEILNLRVRIYLCRNSYVNYHRFQFDISYNIIDTRFEKLSTSDPNIMQTP